MFKNRTMLLLFALAIVAMSMLSISMSISARQLPQGSEYSRVSPLDWYFAHDHAVIDGDNNVVSNKTGQGDSGWTPLDWYQGHDRALLNGDNVVDW